MKHLEELTWEDVEYFCYDDEECIGFFEAVYECVEAEDFEFCLCEDDEECHKEANEIIHDILEYFKPEGA